MISLALIITGVFVLILTLVLCIYCCKSEKCGKHKDMNRESDSTMNLIPPIFYTEDMRDPLYQEDLREKYKHRPSNEG